MKTKIKTPYWKARKLTDLTFIKSVEELNKLNTKRLLSYFKSERMRKIRYRESFNDYDHTYGYELDKKLSYVIDILEEWEFYLNLIKSILNTRENVK